MAQLLRKIDDEVYVEYGRFGLADTDLDPWQTPDPENYHFTAAVRLEAWDGEPAPADTSWTPVQTASFVATSGVVHIQTMMESRGHDFLIGPPLFEYGVAMYFRVLEFDDEDANHCAEAWLLRLWPIRDAFDPLKHAVPFQYIVRDVLGHPIGLTREQLTPLPAAREVPVPVSAVEDWVSTRIDPDGDTFESWLLSLQRRLSKKNITVHAWLRARGVDIEDGAELTPESCASQSRPGVFRDALIDRYYAEQMGRAAVPRRILDEEQPVRGEWLRERADGERIAKELSRAGSRPFSIPVEGRGAEHVPPGISLRLWRWEDDYLGGEPLDGGLTVDRRILAKNPVTRQVFVSGIVTTLRRNFERSGGGLAWYVVRDAEPHEAARVLCAEATWEEDPERRRALDEVAREKLEEMYAVHGRPGN
ncbi:hypothetical protein [Nonomuraea sp. LPB2021202275-12-8]|uniref:hypothetical protein n=1 Tax=Nonomuraea sp. LPB2021202275-12-8 TaxID=3120159 RepID=UPI00300DA425